MAIEQPYVVYEPLVTGTLRIELFGDIGAAKEYIPKARKLLGGLRSYQLINANEEAGNPAGFFYRDFDEPDGTKIRVLVNNEQQVITIITKEAGEVRVIEKIKIPEPVPAKKHLKKVTVIYRHRRESFAGGMYAEWKWYFGTISPPPPGSLFEPCLGVSAGGAAKGFKFGPTILRTSLIGDGFSGVGIMPNPRTVEYWIDNYNGPAGGPRFSFSNSVGSMQPVLGFTDLTQNVNQAYGLTPPFFEGFQNRINAFTALNDNNIEHQNEFHESVLGPTDFGNACADPTTGLKYAVTAMQGLVEEATSMGTEATLSKLNADGIFYIPWDEVNENNAIVLQFELHLIHFEDLRGEWVTPQTAEHYITKSPYDTIFEGPPLFEVIET